MKKNLLYLLLLLVMPSMAQNMLTNWTNIGLAGDTVTALGCSGNKLVAGTKNGIYLTTDGGLNWLPFNRGLVDSFGNGDRSIVSLILDGNKIIVTTYNQNIFIKNSIDTFGSWAQTNIRNRTGYGMLTDITKIGSVGYLAGGPNDKNYKSLDGGYTWLIDTIGDAFHSQALSFDNYVIVPGWVGNFLSCDQGAHFNLMRHGTLNGDFGAVGYVKGPGAISVYSSGAGASGSSIWYLSNADPINWSAYPYAGVLDTAYSWRYLDTLSTGEYIRRFVNDGSIAWGVGNTHNLYKFLNGGYYQVDYTSIFNIKSVATNNQNVFIGLEGGGVMSADKNCYMGAYYQIRPQSYNTSNGVYYCYEQSWGNINSYLWDFGDGTTDSHRFPVHNYTTPGKYKICLTVSGPSSLCSNTYCDTSFYIAFKTDGFGQMSQINVVDGSALGISEPSTVSELSIYPNPSDKLIHIPHEDNNSGQCRIYNAMGQIVLDTPSLPESIDVSSYTKGLYYILMSNENGNSRGKFVIR